MSNQEMIRALVDAQFRRQTGLESIDPARVAKTTVVTRNMKLMTQVKAGARVMTGTCASTCTWPDC